MRSTCCDLVLFLVTILANKDVHIDENIVEEQCSWSHNIIPLALILCCWKSLGSHITKKWSIKNIQHRDYGEHDRSHLNERSVSDD